MNENQRLSEMVGKQLNTSACFEKCFCSNVNAFISRNHAKHCFGLLKRELRQKLFSGDRYILSLS